jgi:hypothetical protein
MFPSIATFKPFCEGDVETKFGDYLKLIDVSVILLKIKFPKIPILSSSGLQEICFSTQLQKSQIRMSVKASQPSLCFSPWG